MAAIRSTIWRVPARLSLGSLRNPSMGRRNFSVSVDRRAGWGFIGLGQMGYQMAKNLHSKIPASDTLYIHDIMPEVMTKFQAEVKAMGAEGAGIRSCGRVRDVAQDASTIITVLPEPSHVKNVYSQLLQPTTPSTSPPEKLFIDCSTIDPTTSRSVATAIQTTRLGTFIDAPMSGGVLGATNATLTFMISSPPHLLPTITPILQKMGRRVIHCGPQIGSGLAAKLANNYLLAINNIATAEAMNLGMRMGLDKKVLADLINVSTGKCWPSEVNNPVPGVVEGAPAGRDYAGGFGVGLMRKDLGLAVDAAREAGAELALGERAREFYEVVERDEKCKGKDFSVVYRFIGGKEN